LALRARNLTLATLPAPVLDPQRLDAILSELTRAVGCEDMREADRCLTALEPGLGALPSARFEQVATRVRKLDDHDRAGAHGRLAESHASVARGEREGATVQAERARRVLEGLLHRDRRLAAAAQKADRPDEADRFEASARAAAAELALIPGSGG